ncbi:hypothetical protein C3B55_00652 [Candidatus Pseudomonas adelgestsugas]|uniref:Uncharacterized protein n=1 Tax=Candidatus Pseudomonas adelgestsugas TaxID=1302376 RepID=A0ABX5R8M1_9PSED|nr:hypothetical protein C3B55_00652 [Candidatus Pseudomonas adelgestsugas]
MDYFNPLVVTIVIVIYNFDTLDILDSHIGVL